MMDRFTRVLAGLLGRSARLLPASRRGWAAALLAEAGEVPAGAARAAWLAGGLWLVAREVLTRAIPVLAFAAGAAGVVWAGWPGSSSNSAVPVNRMYVVGTVVLLAVLPVLIRRHFGPVRAGWAPRAARVGGYAAVLALIAAKTVKDRDGSKLGAYFAVVPGIWVLEIVLLLLIVGYVAGLLILTSRRRVRLTRRILPIGIGLGVVTAGALFALAPFGVSIDPNGPSLIWWVVGVQALPLATGFIAVRRAARDTRPQPLGPVPQGALAASCAAATAALLLAALTSVTIALFPRQVPLQSAPPDNGGACPTCDQSTTVIPPGLRHEYLTEMRVGQAGGTPMAALLIAPFLGAWLGVVGGGLARTSPGAIRRAGGGPYTPSPPPPEPAHAQAQAPWAAPAQPRPSADKAVVWSAYGLVTPALLTAIATLPGPTPTHNNHIEPWLVLVTLVYFMAWLAAGAQMLGTWYQQRSAVSAAGRLRADVSSHADQNSAGKPGQNPLRHGPFPGLRRSWRAAAPRPGDLPGWRRGRPARWR